MSFQSIRALLPEWLRTAAKNVAYRRRYRGLAVGRGTRIVNSQFGKYVDLAGDVFVSDSAIGDYTYLGQRTVLWRARFGKFCSVGPDCHIGLGAHPIQNAVSTHPALYLNRPSRKWTFVESGPVERQPETRIGNDVWIGWRVGVRSGVTIGDGAVIGAGAIVLHDIPPYAIAVGVPARVMRFRFSESEIAFLLALRWWDRDSDWLHRHAHRFSDIAELMKDVRV